MNGPSVRPNAVGSADCERLAASLDDLRFELAEEIAEAATALAASVEDAAIARNSLELRFRAGLLSKTVRSLLSLVAELGNSEAPP